MSLKPENLFDLLPTNLDQELFTEIVATDNIKIERIVSRGHSSPESGWYDQEDNEWVVVLKGEAMLSFEQGDDIHLTTGSHLQIPAHTKHKVTWTSPDTETVWLAVHYP